VLEKRTRSHLALRGLREEWIGHARLAAMIVSFQKRYLRRRHRHAQSTCPEEIWPAAIASVSPFNDTNRTAQSNTSDRYRHQI
jgi:hypothetical protein